MTQQQLENLYIQTEHGTFTPRYTFDDYNTKTDEYVNLVIVQSAQEVYDEWLVNKDNTVVPPIEESVFLSEELIETNLLLTDLELELLELKRLLEVK